jgi:alanine racemase
MSCRVHIKADTGMNRIGFTSEATFTEAILLLKRSPNLVLDGLFTHFAVSELEDTSFTLQQAERFRRYVQIARDNGLHPLLHASNSAAALHIPKRSSTWCAAASPCTVVTPRDMRWKASTCIPC